MDCSLPGSSVYGILQARILKWVAISSSRGSSWPRDWSSLDLLSHLNDQHWVKCLKKEKVKWSCIWLFVIPWTVAYQDPLSMGFSRQEYWSGLPFPSPGDLPDQGLNPCLPPCRQTLYHLSHQGSLSCTKFLGPAHALWTVLSAAPPGIRWGAHLLPCRFPGRSSQLSPPSVVWVTPHPAGWGAGACAYCCPN